MIVFSNKSETSLKEKIKTVVRMFVIICHYNFAELEKNFKNIGFNIRGNGFERNMLWKDQSYDKLDTDSIYIRVPFAQTYRSMDCDFGDITIKLQKLSDGNITFDLKKNVHPFLDKIIISNIDCAKQISSIQSIVGDDWFRLTEYGWDYLQWIIDNE